RASSTAPSPTTVSRSRTAASVVTRSSSSPAPRRTPARRGTSGTSPSGTATRAPRGWSTWAAGRAIPTCSMVSPTISTTPPPPAAPPASRAYTAPPPDMRGGGDSHAVEGSPARDARAREPPAAPSPTPLEPVDDLPPATMITSVRRRQGKLAVRGVSEDNGAIASVTVNGRPARLVAAHAGVTDWEIVLDPPRDGQLVARATDAAGNAERTPHVGSAR